jgi:hypothetical protein
MCDAGRESCVSAGRFPSCLEAFEPPPLVGKNPRAVGSFLQKLIVLRPLLSQEVAELDRHGEDACLLVLGCARFQPYGLVIEVDLAPLERQYFTQAAPTRDVGKLHDWLDVAGQVTQNFQEL